MSPLAARLTTTDTPPEPDAELGGIVFASAVNGANVLRDMREAITNTLGGEMTRYEALIDRTMARAMERLAEAAAAQGYDGVLGIRVSHPVITDGAVEVVLTGTGWRRRSG